MIELRLPSQSAPEHVRDRPFRCLGIDSGSTGSSLSASGQRVGRPYGRRRTLRVRLEVRRVTERSGRSVLQPTGTVL